MKSFRASLEIFVPILLILGGLSIVGLSFIYSVEVSGGPEWIEVPAEITYTYSVHAYGGRTGSGIEYVPIPSYIYTTLEGQQYYGYKYSTQFKTTKSLDFLGGNTETPATVQGSIFYNPENPSQSAVLHPPDSIGVVIVLLLLSFLLVLSGCVILVERLKDWRFVREMDAL